MMNSLKTEYAPRLTLDVETARELMTPNPVSIREYATVKEAVALLIDKGISAAPVIDRAGPAHGCVEPERPLSTRS
jgi:CBS domain-containing protein